VLARTKSDLPVLQNLIDDRVFNKSQRHELQSVGVAFGDVLTSELPLRWVMGIPSGVAPCSNAISSTSVRIRSTAMTSFS
jgi:hypothetical protein